jgi:hypothetical protein
MLRQGVPKPKTKVTTLKKPAAFAGVGRKRKGPWMPNKQNITASRKAQLATIAKGAAEPKTKKEKSEKKDDDIDDSDDDESDSNPLPEPVESRLMSRRVAVRNTDIWVPDPYYMAPQVFKSDEDKNRITKLLTSNRSGLFTSLDVSSVRQIVNAADKVQLSPGEYVFQEGDDADFMVIVDTGLLEGLKEGEPGGSSRVLKTFTNDDFADVAAVLYGFPRTMSLLLKHPPVCLRSSARTSTTSCATRTTSEQISHPRF